MNVATTRCPNGDETGFLRNIWREAFGSSDVEAFFTHMFDSNRCIVVVNEGAPVSAGYLLPAGTLRCKRTSVPCAMIYGVATLPEYRSRGYGASIVRKLISTGWNLGFPAVAICPSEASLFDYYSKCAGFREWFFINERRYIEAEISNHKAIATKITPDEYFKLRESLLVCIPHIMSDISVISYQQELCRELGGGLFKFDTSGGQACAIVERQPSGEVCVKELLSNILLTTGVGEGNDSEAEVLSWIVSAFPASEIIVRTPVRLNNRYDDRLDSRSDFIRETDASGSKEIQRHTPNTEQVRSFGMLVLSDTLFVPPESLICFGSFKPPGSWFGLALD